jgi:hypothetical protein
MFFDVLTALSGRFLVAFDWHMLRESITKMSGNVLTAIRVAARS